jgi:L-idonate 5-dehydrogenase
MSPREVIEIVAAGVCGSDIQRMRAGFSVKSLGHELVGRRPGGSGLLAVRPLNPCRFCSACVNGWTEQCLSDASIGRFDTGDGGFSGTVMAAPTQLYPVPEHIPTPVATLADPLACVLHALAGIELQGNQVLVIGDGPMAALAAIFARSSGAEVSVAVKGADRIDRLSGLGCATVVVGELTDGRYPVVVEAVGGSNGEPVSRAVAAVAALGRVVCLGVYPSDVTASLPVRDLLEKECTLRGSKAYRVNDDLDDFAHALALLSDNPGLYSPIITSTRRWSPADRQPPSLERQGALKVVFINELALIDATKL